LVLTRGHFQPTPKLPQFHRATIPRFREILARWLEVFWQFRGFSAGIPCRGRKGTAKFPSRKSRLIGKILPFRGNSAELPTGILT